MSSPLQFGAKSISTVPVRYTEKTKGVDGWVNAEVLKLDLEDKANFQVVKAGWPKSRIFGENLMNRVESWMDKWLPRRVHKYTETYILTLGKRILGYCRVTQAGRATSIHYLTAAPWNRSGKKFEESFRRIQGHFTGIPEALIGSVINQHPDKPLHWTPMDAGQKKLFGLNILNALDRKLEPEPETFFGQFFLPVPFGQFVLPVPDVQKLSTVLQQRQENYKIDAQATQAAQEALGALNPEPQFFVTT
ncbi:MAG TPA: hypothetical protein V6C52_09055 [Coleofasciculaceae cyanobacterium]